MRLERRKNAGNIILFGSINNIVSVVLPFMLRTLMIYQVGELYLGVNSLFTSILSILNLAELGFGSAVAVSMYKPVAEDDTPTICALMGLYRRIYNIVGTLILIAGLSLMPFLGVLTNGECPEGLNIYVLYIFYLGSTVSSYFLFAYKQVLLSVHQRADLGQRVSIVCKAITCALQALVLVFLGNIYLYVLLNVLNSALNNVICARIASKRYPQYYCEGRVPQETMRQIYKKVSGLLIQRVGRALSTQLDTIIISTFLGLVLVARYSNYMYIVGSVGAFLLNFFASMTAGIGNLMVLESKEKVHALFLEVQFVSSWIVGWCSVCLLVLSQPFMQLWVGEEMMLGDATVVCLVVYFYVMYNKRAVPTFKDAAGLWWEDKWKPLVAGLTNVCINVVLVQTIGINGVIISTIISYLFIEIPWETHVLFKYSFQCSAWKYYVRHGQFLFVTALAAASTYWVCSCLPSAGVLSFVAKGGICVIMPNLIFLLAYHKKEEFAKMLQMGKRILLKK